METARMSEDPSKTLKQNVQNLQKPAKPYTPVCTPDKWLGLGTGLGGWLPGQCGGQACSQDVHSQEMKCR
eukprot:320513-Heterocapsa_arctica.AAC.1